MINSQHFVRNEEYYYNSYVSLVISILIRTSNVINISEMFKKLKKKTHIQSQNRMKR